MTEKFYHHGLTLLQLLIGLTIIGITASLALPGYQHWLARNQTMTQVHQLTAFIHQARITAISYGTPVIVCPAKSSNKCAGDWADGLLLFADVNDDNKFDVGDTVINFIAGIHAAHYWRWRGFPNQQQLYFSADGNSSTGSFIFCPAQLSDDYARKIIVNRLGRVRVEKLAECVT